MQWSDDSELRCHGFNVFMTSFMKCDTFLWISHSCWHTSLSVTSICTYIISRWYMFVKMCFCSFRLRKMGIMPRACLNAFSRSLNYYLFSVVLCRLYIVCKHYNCFPFCSKIFSGKISHKSHVHKVWHRSRFCHINVGKRKVEIEELMIWNLKLLLNKKILCRG